MAMVIRMGDTGSNHTGPSRKQDNRRWKDGGQREGEGCVREGRIIKLIDDCTAAGREENDQH